MAHLLISPSAGESTQQCVSELCQQESTKGSEVGPAINRLQPKFIFSTRDIISLAGLARGPSSVSLRFSQALRICFVTDTHLVYSSAMSLGNLSVGTQQKKRLQLTHSRQRGRKTITEPQNTQDRDKKIQISIITRDLREWIAKRMPKVCKNE